MYFTRKLEKLLKEALQQFPAILVTGARQVGKSTLLQEVLPQLTYVTLDDLQKKALANTDPELFLSTHPAPLIIDEIQYAPNLLPYIKMKIDQKRDLYGQYILTGSQVFQLMQGVSESLAGRIALFSLYPFSWEEIIKIPEKQKTIFNDNTVAKQIINGFYPEFLKNPDLNLNIWFNSYLSLYIERDVRNIKSVSDLNKFQVFMGLLAARSGQLLNLAEVSKECGISQPTAKDWLTILQATYIIYLLKPYHYNRSKRLVKSPKLYFVDTGLLCHLLGIDSSERFFKIPDRGHIFENMVIMEAIKRASYQQKRSEFYFYRTASGIEVDLVTIIGGKTSAYEIKFSKTIKSEMADSLKIFSKEITLEEAAILSLAEEKKIVAPNISVYHFSQFRI